MSFMRKIYSGSLQGASRVLGYTEEEVSQIERLYEIDVRGDFRDFMLEMGRCSGGLFGDDSIVLYRNRRDCSVRRHIMSQSYTIDEICDALRKSIRKYKPFYFARISETQYFYVLTAEGQEDVVYHYDENCETVKSTHKSFLEFMKEQAEYYGPRQSVYICQGELIKF